MGLLVGVFEGFLVGLKHPKKMKVSLLLLYVRGGTRKRVICKQKSRVLTTEDSRCLGFVVGLCDFVCRMSAFDGVVMPRKKNIKLIHSQLNVALLAVM